MVRRNEMQQPARRLNECRGRELYAIEWRRSVWHDDADTAEIEPGHDGDMMKEGAKTESDRDAGHTRGSICVNAKAEGVLAAGDTLFSDSIADRFAGGDGRKILESIHTRLLTLPEETEVICGHGPATTIGRERERNPFLQG